MDVIEGKAHRFVAATDAECDHPEGWLREVPVYPVGVRPDCPEDVSGVMMCDRCAMVVGYVA